MKIPGQKPGPPGAEPPIGPEAGPVDEVSKTSRAKALSGGQAAGKPFAETLATGRAAPAAASRAVEPAPPASVAGPTSSTLPLTADIAADLKAGKLGPEAALERVVERVLDRQLGPGAPAALRDQVRNALRDTLSADPMIADRLRGLG
jgi:hypothetical protein